MYCVDVVFDIMINSLLGLTDSKEEGVFKWIDGTPYNASIFNYWRKENGEPNDYGNNEDCAETTWDGKWNDNNCQTEFGFICKRKSGLLSIQFSLIADFVVDKLYSNLLYIFKIHLKFIGNQWRI